MALLQSPRVGVVGAYFRKSDNGQMVTELFYGWVANHFISHIPHERPVVHVVLLVGGHPTHIDVELSKICKEYGILLSHLLPHPSHTTQPLDVGFFWCSQEQLGGQIQNCTHNMVIGNIRWSIQHSLGRGREDVHNCEFVHKRRSIPY